MEDVEHVGLQLKVFWENVVLMEVRLALAVEKQIIQGLD